MFLNPLTFADVARLRLRSRSRRQTARREDGESVSMCLDVRIKQENGYLFIGVVGEYGCMDSRDLIDRVK